MPSAPMPMGFGAADAIGWPVDSRNPMARNLKKSTRIRTGGQCPLETQPEFDRNGWSTIDQKKWLVGQKWLVGRWLVITTSENRLVGRGWSIATNQMVGRNLGGRCSTSKNWLVGSGWLPKFY